MFGIAVLAIYGIDTFSNNRARAKQDTKATAVLLPDYTWHMTLDGVVTKDSWHFCFNEDLGHREVLTCAPNDSLLGWRVPINTKP